MWAGLCRLGKTVRLQISVRYMEDSPPPQSRYDKRGRTSVTKRMLTDRDAQLDAEDASRQPSVWREKDPAGKRHYKLRTHQLRSLVRYVEKGGILETHNDIPDNLRKQLYVEDNERSTKHKSHPNTPPGSMYPPINITVLPNQASLPVTTGENALIPCPSIASKAINSGLVEIPGLLDVAVEEYSKWQQSRVSRDILKDDIRKARDLALANGLDLQQIHCDQDPDFFIKQGISVGVARRFVSEITQWAKLYASVHQF
ncbi:unnamed protein product [Penicillium nalgiovense]|uniref:Uncharacterized protein n=1 Tax=Penicillium nalgiovense TaxID=60175 RepID=A0A9W4HW33_PENNA|nr:unnamed protein product [Penicillium nalgiovense]CAG8026958.1 unnamed protein product [Penicillium nalgiovense]CAG8106483.1 unnamed protein product [Penicillium nalgiovense]CAG8127621.1 unnamed protein product [Penicillium nalgiovense]CAG8128260.1 unnamed protein product [Penicillium nalgiovense]